MIDRILEEAIRTRLDDKKVIVIYGPRQAGKTTLMNSLVKKGGRECVWWNGDEPDIRKLLEEASSTKLQALIGNKKLLIIDEAQRIKDIGIVLKLIHDNLPEIKVIASGSSSFDLSNQINEPLTGRKWEFYLYTFSSQELMLSVGLLEEKRMLEHRMVYGLYPQIVNHPGEEKELLRELSSSYLYKDILTWEAIKKPEKLERLIQALAFQIGNEVSYHELGQTCGLDNETIEKYVGLLEKAFIIFRLGSFSRNLRNELKKKRKIYFYDNGIRNSVINNFNPVHLRDDSGPLWENFLISERVKYLSYHRKWTNNYFWRTHSQQEIDYIEERDGKLFAFELKWNEKKVSFPQSFLAAYPSHELKVINRSNFEDFIYQF